MLSTILATHSAVLFTTPALAQQQSAPAPFRNTDANGVDFVTGTYTFDMVEGSIGKDSDALVMRRYWGESGWRDNWSGDLRIDASNNAVITFGGVSERFNWNGSAYAPVKANGASLSSPSANVYLYRSAHGTTVEYRSPLIGLVAGTRIDMGAMYCNANNASSCGLPSKITTPDGLVTDLTWQKYTFNIPNGTRVPDRFVSYRLNDVRTNKGYGAKIKFQTETLASNAIPNDGWFRRSSVKLLDLSQVFCAPTALNCDSVAGTWPTVAYQQSTATEDTIVDTGGGAWKFTREAGANRLTAIRRPDSATEDVTIQYSGATPTVTNVTVDGSITTYGRTVSGDTATTTITNPISAVGTVTANTTVAQPTNVQRPGAPRIQNLFDPAGRKTREIDDEGNYTNWTYDSRGNVTETRYVAKSGSGLPDIVETASYPATCANPLTCNKPEFTIDAKGNRTDYTYDATHGEVTKVQLPSVPVPSPGSGSARPEINIGYTALQAQIKDASGNLVNNGPVQYKPTQITRCATAATCAGTPNETKVTMAYGTPNLLITSLTTAAGDNSVSATATFTYDNLDNLETEDGPLPGPDDKRHYFYDAGNRIRGIIEPDPDGAGPRLRVARRYSYNSSGKVTNEATGSVSGTAATDIENMTPAWEIQRQISKDGRPTKEMVVASGIIEAVTQYSYDPAQNLICVAQRMTKTVFASLPSGVNAACSQSLPGAPEPDRIVRQIYSTYGRLEAITEGNGTADLSDVARFTYTLNGRTATVKDGENNLTTYEYDGHDRLLKTRYPVATLGAASSSTTDYEQANYDANGNVTQRRLRDGQLGRRLIMA